jgi:hypothetical protein
MMRRRPPALNVSGAAEADADFARLEDNRHLTTAVGELQHLGKSVFVLEDVEVLKWNLAAGVGLPGPGGVGSKIFAKNDHFFIHFFVSRAG